MKRTANKPMEQILRAAAPSSPARKQALRAWLFDETGELSLDDLALAAGGRAQPEPEAWAVWPEERDAKTHE